MSYILDALNKSEQERKNRQAPGLETVHRSMPPPARSSRAWIGGLLVIVALNAGFLAYWFVSRTSAPSAVAESAPVPALTRPAPPSPVLPPAPTPRAAPDTAQTDMGRAQPPAGVLVTPSDALTENPPAPIAATDQKPLRIADLPVDVQQQIPDLTFSSHIYSDDAKFRMVNINGKLLHEGDMVADGIRLVRITEQGVVLSFQGYTFKVSVLHDWSFN